MTRMQAAASALVQKCHERRVFHVPPTPALGVGHPEIDVATFELLYGSPPRSRWYCHASLGIW